MGEETLLERLTQGPQLLALVVFAVMALLGSLAGVFTFCVRKKRADDAVGRRKKTDESTPDDKDTTVAGSQATPQNTTVEDRTHREAGAEENGIHPTTTPRDGEFQTRPFDSSTSQQRTKEKEKEEEEEREERGDVKPFEEEAPSIREEASDRERPRENGIEEVSQQTSAETEVFGDNVHQTDEENSGDAVAMVSGEVDGVEDVVVVNGGEVVSMVNGDTHKKGRWSFPPQLEDFDLMSTDIDPAELELMFSDDRLVEIYLELEPDSPGLGISIVGGSGSPSGDLPIIIKRVLPNSVAERDGRLKSGDELLAVNDSLLVGVAKDVAIATLSNLSGNVRLLVLQDD